MSKQILQVGDQVGRQVWSLGI